MDPRLIHGHTTSTLFFLNKNIHWILQQYTKHQHRLFYILCEIIVEHKCMGLGCISKNPHTRHSTNAGLLLGQRRRRWTNSKPALVECPVFTGSDMGHCRSSLSAAANTHETRKASPWGTHHNLNQIGMATSNPDYHETMKRCWCNVRPQSRTLTQH